MKALGTFVLEGLNIERVTYETVQGVVEEWLARKARIVKDRGDGSFDLELTRDKREASLRRHDVLCSDGSVLRDLSLAEPITSGKFITSIQIAYSGNAIAVTTRLVGLDSDRYVRPTAFDPHPPRFLRDLLALPIAWRYSGDFIQKVPLILDNPMRTYAECEQFWDKLMSPVRRLPLVMVSPSVGVDLKSLAADFHERLLCVAHVVGIGRELSWEISQSRGKEWSCFNGAVKLYWPGHTEETGPFTRIKLRDELEYDASDGLSCAYRRYAERLMREILELSSDADIEPELPNRVRSIYRQDLRDQAQRKRVEDEGGAEYTIELERENVELKERCDALEEEAKEHRQKIWNLSQIASRTGGGRGRSPAAIDLFEPHPEDAPDSLTMAIMMAEDRYPECLKFGADVGKGLATVAPDAGPPSKVHRWLLKLAELADLLRTNEGKLGQSYSEWLESRGVVASGESETIRSNPKAQQARTWDADGQSKIFDLHLKPCEATSPGRCVRIYFAWIESQKKIVVGWVGRHP